MWAKNTMTFEVTDTGCGISKSHLSELFTPFFQVEQLEEREGTGLGLSIVKKEIELMKGNISVDSTINKGTTFTFQIPMTKSLEAKDESSVARIIQDLDDGQEWRIMLIDNDKINKELLSDLFTLNHFKVFQSNYDENAIEYAKINRPHALYFNLKFPLVGNSGILLRIKEVCPDIVLIGITSEIHDNHSDVIASIGCQEIIYKPFDINRVLYKLGKLLPIKYKYQESTDLEEIPIKNIVLDWEEIGRIMSMEELNTFWDYFSNGNLSAIELAAQGLKDAKPALKDLCKKLAAWAKEFNDSEIGLCLEKIEQIKERLE